MSVTLCDSAGVMYWGDAYYKRIEAANIDGSGRTVILMDDRADYFGFAFHDGIIYYTDSNIPYVYLLSRVLRCEKGGLQAMTMSISQSVCLSVCRQSLICKACAKTTKPINVKM